MGPGNPFKRNVPHHRNACDIPSTHEQKCLRFWGRKRLTDGADEVVDASAVVADAAVAEDATLEAVEDDAAALEDELLSGG